MPKLIHLWPVEGVHALPWPSREWDATPEEWADIRMYVPPPFTDIPPGVRAIPEAPRGASPDPGGTD